MVKKQTIDNLIKSIKKDFGANCPDVAIDCASCKAKRLIDYLIWYKDLCDFAKKK